MLFTNDDSWQYLRTQVKIAILNVIYKDDRMEWNVNEDIIFR